MGVPLIVAAFIISGILRVAPGVEAAGYGNLQLSALVTTVAAGSVILSHFNDSGFWLVSRFFNMDEKTTFKTWTVMETLIGLVGFTLALGIFYAVALI